MHKSSRRLHLHLHLHKLKPGCKDCTSHWDIMHYTDTSSITWSVETSPGVPIILHDTPTLSTHKNKCVAFIFIPSGLGLTMLPECHVQWFKPEGWYTHTWYHPVATSKPRLQATYGCQFTHNSSILYLNIYYIPRYIVFITYWYYLKIYVSIYNIVYTKSICIRLTGQPPTAAT